MARTRCLIKRSTRHRCVPSVLRPCPARPRPPARPPGLALALVLVRAVHGRRAAAPGAWPARRGPPGWLARARARPRARARTRACTHSCSCARQARWREKEAKCTVEKHEALPGYLDRLAAANPGSVIKLRKDADGCFRSVFVMLRGTVEAVSMCARGVTASDMGHTTNHYWHGCCAIAVTKFGSGFEVPIWFLMSVGHEDGAKWAHAAEMVSLMDVAKDWYDSGITHFGDRCKGMDRFTDAWLNLTKLNCAGHILENAQEHGAKHQEHFKINHFWKLQGSASADQAARNMALFDGAPRVQSYLIAIEKKLWIWWYVAEERRVTNGGRTPGPCCVHCARTPVARVPRTCTRTQVHVPARRLSVIFCWTACRRHQVLVGASTHEERCNNMAEHSQGTAKQLGIRASDALDAVWLAVNWMCNVVAKEVGLHRQLVDDGQSWVPHAQAHKKTLVERAGKYSPAGGPKIFTVSASIDVIDLDAGNLHDRTVNMEDNTCSCGKWQDKNMPCGCAAGVAVYSGLGINALMDKGAACYYRVQPGMTDVEVVPVPKPTLAALALAKAAKEDAGKTRHLAWASSTNGGASEVDACLPPTTTKQDHENKKNKRYSKTRGRGSGGGAAKGRTQKAASSTAVKYDAARARQMCAACAKAGRTGPDAFSHKGPCPRDPRHKVP